MQHRRKVERVSFGVIGRMFDSQQVTAADQLVHRPNSEARHDLPHFLGDEEEIIDHVLGLSGEARAQLRILGCDSDGAGVEMTLPHHHAAFDNQRRRSKSEFVGAEHGGDDDVATSLELAVGLEPDASAQIVHHECLLGFG